MPGIGSPLRETPSQTAGPFLHIGLVPEEAGLARFGPGFGRCAAADDAPGERVRIDGRVLDATGAPLTDALVESWQADPAGRYAHPADPRVGEIAPGFHGFARSATDATSGIWTLETVKPGPVPVGPDWMAPHIALFILARGINLGLHTRLLFADEPAANAACPVLAQIRPEPRRATLLAATDGPGRYRFDIRLAGEGETVFFDL